ncbi:hypothetical protein KJS94_16975 [Flavihumibacter rivuli]|uniref:hypothetical protein n=1 Tax=Flavihumibacter rivuli TaxID=2838156 RepID=UPI001BDEB917|nr:hypothetical protein [Flavihumibacter rivuli]ULQ56345.1 hypothetical protein KJS94_16975 [Flavihumibacter rivuli]
MKRFFILITFLFTLSAAGLAQPKPEQKARLEALKVAYLTRRLNLSTEEAQRFWPVYNKYTEEFRSTQLQYRDGNNELEREEKLLAIRKKYHPEFSKALNPDKANEFFKAEKEFYSHIQRELMERKMERRKNIN